MTMKDNSLYKDQSESLLDDYVNRSDFFPKEMVGMRATRVRWVVLVLACISCLGSYFSNSLLSVLQTFIMRILDIKVFGFNAIIALSAVPNVILPFVAGLIVDRLGLRLAYGCFAICALVGQAILTFGIFSKSVVFILIGQGISALGGETIIVAKSAMIAKWFIGKELSLALGAVTCFARLGTIASIFTAPKIVIYLNDLDLPFFIGTALCGLSCVSVLILNYVDKKADIVQQNIDYGQPALPPFKFSDLKKFKSVYYLLIMNSALLYAGVFCLMENITNMLFERFHVDIDVASNLIPMVYILPILLTPFFGMMGDNKGKRVVIILFASVLFLVDHIIIANLPPGTDQSPNYQIFICLFGVGLFYALFIGLFWPCIALIVGQRLMGVAYGLAFSAQNLLLAILPLGLGYIHDKMTDEDGQDDDDLGYVWTEYVLAGVVAVGIVMGAWAYSEDKRTGGRLDQPGTSGEDSLRSKDTSIMSAPPDEKQKEFENSHC